VLTLPAAAAGGALCYGITRIFGTGATGPVVVAAAILLVMTSLFAQRARATAATA
jgi:hypothetical protein